MNKLTNISIHNGLVDLMCNGNQLTSLSLPPSLERLFCYENNFTDEPDLPWSLIKCNGQHPQPIQLAQHNEKRRKLGLENVCKFPTKEEWDDINERYTDSKYMPGGYMFEHAQQEIQSLLK